MQYKIDTDAREFIQIPLNTCFSLFSPLTSTRLQDVEENKCVFGTQNKKI